MPLDPHGPRRTDSNIPPPHPPGGRRCPPPTPQALGFVDLPTLMGVDVTPDESLLGLAQVGAAVGGPLRGGCGCQLDGPMCDVRACMRRLLFCSSATGSSGGMLN